MITLIQRVGRASVTVENQEIAAIGRGLLALVAIQPDDNEQKLKRMVQRLLTYRVFPDAAGRMNKSLLDERLALLAVPQFTLAADTRKGTRPSFTSAATAEIGAEYFARFVGLCTEKAVSVQCGRFGADMQVSLVNDGPVTFWLET